VFGSAGRALAGNLLMAAPGDGLNHACVDSGDEIDDCIKVFARDTRFQRPLDTPVASGLAPAAQRNRQANEGLLAFREHCVCVSGREVIAKGRFGHVQLLILLRVNGF